MIRNATLNDLPQLVELGRAMHQESPRFGLLPFSAKQMGQTFYSLLTNDAGFVMVAERDGQVVGTLAAMVTPHYFSEALIASDVGWFVLPEHRGGLDAARLVKRYLCWAKDKGALITQMGVSTGIHAQQTTRMLERLGLKQFGSLLEA